MPSAEAASCDSTASAEMPPAIVAVIGAATAGAEIAARLADLGARVVVFEQNSRPYGKIEDGLPRWHVGLRRKEYENIVEKLSRPGIDVLFNTKVGRDISFEEIAREWGFSAVVLACGAWRDRPLPVEGIDQYVGKGLIYQNPFVIWFNHANEAGYAGERFDVQDDALVVGGGLASIDVVKILMLECTRKRLLEDGLQATMVELEVKGIPRILEQHGMRFEDLGLKGCTLFYRRRIEDMPLVDAPEGADAKRLDKVRAARHRLVQKAQEKYCFQVEPLAAPDAPLAEGGRLVGLRFRRTKVEGGRVIPTEETFERRGSCVVSSIGSIPEPIVGIEMKGELFAFSDWDLGRLDEYPNVFSVGNVVTGKGNIVASRKHAGHVSEAAVESFLGLRPDYHIAEDEFSTQMEAAGDEAAEQVAKEVARAPRPSPETVRDILERVRKRKEALGYNGNLAEWLARVTPPDLE